MIIIEISKIKRRKIREIKKIPSNFSDP